MAAKKPGPVALTIAVEKAAESVGGPSRWLCLECHDVLDVHQPDAANPARLLGTCPECGEWYVLDFEESLDEPQCLMLHLPTADDLRRAREEEPARAQPRRSGYRPSLGAGS